ncbi:5-carboxymethyl-2-hydroxymuconate Delta-isomerase [Kitasatospora sp. NPDC059571]|uniref:5-carboxymethyl-2-hydroxymuconate Delta-isomerase n=1 Tax=Kitasatospora sp. NPDC059571 TaxID=3346871 RepID=UPI00368721D8
MPQIWVEHSRGLAFDRRGFAAELHPVVAELIDTTVEACKTRFRTVEEEFLGDGEPGRSAVYLELRILTGRPPALRTELSRRALALLEKHVPGERVHLAVNVTELDRDVYLSAAR